MLSLAQILRLHGEEPAPASPNSALVSTWSQKETNELKRKKSDSDFCISKKRPSVVDEEKRYVENIQLRPEVTLTIISKKSCTSLREFVEGHVRFPDSFKYNKMVCQAIPVSKNAEEEIEEDISPNEVLNNLGNYKEIELTRISPPRQNANHVNQEYLFQVYSPSDDDEKVSTNPPPTNMTNKPETLSTGLIADRPFDGSPRTGNVPENIPNTPETSPKKYSMTTRIQSRLEKAAAGLLRQRENEEIQPSANIDFDDNSNNNFNSPTGRVKIYNLQKHKIKHVPEQVEDTNISPLFNDEPQLAVVSSSSVAPTDPDFDPFSNIGTTVEDWWPISKERPYYAHGLPNPVGENRCWVNATLQALFGLPVFEDLVNTDTSKFSKLIRSLSNIQSYWKRGMTRNHGYNSSFNNFKEELSVLDKGYSSRAQQDVSEFLMNLLNFIKTEFESKLKEESNEIENIPNNEQDTPRKSQNSPYESNKRSPLADISASTGQSRHSQVTNNEQEVGSSKNVTSTKSQNGNETDTKSNPIDDNFSLYMVENYVCGKCAKVRQQKVENLMLFIDLPSEDWGDALSLVDMINTTCGTEQRELTCESCKHKKFTMNMKLQKLPRILTVQVKRYEMSNEGFLNKKSSPIDIPRKLQLDRLVIYNDEEFTTSPIYEPIGIISHIGDSIDSGHYISFVKHEDKWFYYDDASVRILTDDEVFKVVQNNAYMIFFRDIEHTKGG